MWFAEDRAGAVVGPVGRHPSQLPQQKLQRALVSTGQPGVRLHYLLITMDTSLQVILVPLVHRRITVPSSGCWLFHSVRHGSYLGRTVHHDTGCRFVQLVGGCLKFYFHQWLLCSQFGCAGGYKQDTLVTWLADACQHDCRIITGESTREGSCALAEALCLGQGLALRCAAQC